MTRGWIAGIAFLAACADTTLADDALDTADEDLTPSEPAVVLLSEVGFEPDVGGISRGFDLDGAVTGPADGSGCGRVDLNTPEGDPGVDNAFGALLPIIATLGGEALQSLVQNAVLSGELLLIFELDALESTPVGECTTGRIVRGVGAPAIGTQGGILPGQTFDVSTVFPSAELGCVKKLEDGAVEAEGVELRLPLQVFDETIDLAMTNGRMRLEPTDAGWVGVIGGGVSVEAIAENVYGFDAIPASLEEGVVGAVRLNADLSPDDQGVCQEISVTLAVQGLSAFLFADAAR